MDAWPGGRRGCGLSKRDPSPEPPASFGWGNRPSPNRWRSLRSIKLLARSTRGLTPTEAGLGYLERARRALEEAAEAELAARGAGAGLKGRLRICAGVTFARIHLIPLLPQFMAQHPDLDLEVVLDDRQIDLVQEGIDVALRMGKLMDSTLTARRVPRGS